MVNKVLCVLLSVIHVVAIIVWPPTRGSWPTPSDCIASACRYRAAWSLTDDPNIIMFTVAVNQSRNLWTGIAFAPERRMVYSQMQSCCPWLWCLTLRRPHRPDGLSQELDPQSQGQGLKICPHGTPRGQLLSPWP